MNIYSGKKAVILARASSTKQVLKGETIENQISLCRRYADENSILIIKEFKIVESGRKDEERKKFQEVINYCKDVRNKVEVLLFLEIGRLTRQGSGLYDYFKSELVGSGVEVLDTQGIIQPPINLLEPFGQIYDWSVIYPSRSAEIYTAERKRDEVIDFLYRSISAEIVYERGGYLVRGPEFGYKSVRVEEKGKTRSIRVPNPPESTWIIGMYKLRARGGISDEEIVKSINRRGFKTRYQKQRDSVTREIIGKRGGKKLTVKRLNRYIQKPIYAGVVSGKWVPQPFLATKFKGLVSLDTFNKANKGKVRLEVDTQGNVSILKGIKSFKYPDKNTRYNPEFPFKNFVLCPHCRKPLKGSFSTSKSGKKHGYYHCDRGHERFSVKREALIKLVYDRVEELSFRKGFINKLREIVKDKWLDDEIRVSKDLLAMDKRLLALVNEKEDLTDVIAKTSSDNVRKALERKFDALELEIALIREERQDNEKKKYRLEEMLNKIIYIMEHPLKILDSAEGEARSGSVLMLFFAKPVTYEELKGGTPELTEVFKLSEDQDMSKDDLVTPRGIEPRLPG